MSKSKSSLDQIFQAHIQTLALTLQPNTISNYRATTNLFLGYLHTAFPQVRHPAQLRRDPHLLGWFRWLCEQHPPSCNRTREEHLLRLRRLLDDLAADAHPIQPELIRRGDFPPHTHYLPRPLNPDDDHRLQQELRQTDDLYSNALLLMRATGIRRGECTQLALDCLRQLDHDHWALHVPVGKLHTERLVPADDEVRRLVTRILTLRAQAPARQLAQSVAWLLPRCPARLRRSSHPKGDFLAIAKALNRCLTQAAKRAGCSQRVTPHRLRHTFATEMVRFGVSLPALMQLMGHKDVRMTLRYVQIVQQDLQREFHLARQNAVQRHLVPKLPLPASSPSVSFDLPAIRQSLAATRHLLEMYRRQVSDETARRKLQRLNKRLLTVACGLEQLTPPEK